VGDDALSFPLALGVYEALRKRNLLDFDCIVPIPLSPDKAEAGEIHRTRLLARELASLLGTRMVELLELRHPISKHKLRTGQGLTALQFERQYAAALQVEEKAKDFERILLVDDVCTEGSTLRCAATAICAVNPDCEIVAATVGQMILKAVVKDEGQLVV
jgi:predicted amidophosphoribosyltransferase